MKQNIRTIIATAALLFTTVGAWADGVIVIVKQLDESEVSTMSPGNVTYETAGTTCTITVTPEDGYYLKQNGVTAAKTIGSNHAQGRRRVPSIEEGSISVTASAENPTDLSKTSSYSFTMPETPYDVEITVNFGSRTEITANDISLNSDTFIYDGNAKEPGVSVTIGEKQLTLNEDYTIIYNNNQNVPGTNDPSPSVEITGITAYKGTVTKTFTINKATPEITETPIAKMLTYTGDAQELVEAGVVTAGTMKYSKSLSEEFTEAIPEETNAGNYTVYYKVEGNENYNGIEASETNKVSVTINAATITELYDISLTETNLVYNGTEQTPGVIFKKDGQTITPSTNDYDVTYSNNINIGSAEAETNAPAVTITGKNNLTGSVVKKFSIAAKSISTGYTVSVDAGQTYTYTGSNIEPVITVAPSDGGTALVLGTDYTVEYSNNINAATANDGENAPKVTVTGKGNYEGQTFANFDIAKADLANVTIENIADQTYTGEALEPAVVVTFNGQAVAASEYDIAYNNNTDVNTEAAATVTLTSKGINFTASTQKTAYFNIIAATVTITATDQEVTYNGDTQSYTNGSVDHGTLVVTYYTSEENRTNNIGGSTDAPTDANTYYVKLTINETNYEAEPTDVTFTINPATITEVTLVRNSLYYNGESQSVTIATVKAGTLTLTNDDDLENLFNISGTTATDKGTYTVTVAAKENSNFTGSAQIEFTIANRKASEDEFLFAAGQTFATYFNPDEYIDMPESITAYIITGISGNSVVITEISYIPMEVPVLVEKKTSTGRPTEEPATADNMLSHASEDVSLDRNEEYLYVLYNGMFVRTTNNAVAVGSNYLQVPVSTTNGARTLSIIHGDGTTAIKSVESTESSDTNKWYDMQGKRVERPTKAGIYIHNGKKIMIK